MFPTASAIYGKRTLKDRVVYTFPLALLPHDTRQSAFVIVWHEYGELMTYFVPDLGVLKENGEVTDGS